jgi:3-oxoacyl-[acyl-carrier protein] reductase
MDLGLKGLRAVVTGGTKGIGRAIAQTLVAEGAHVALCARNADEVAKTEKDFGGSGARVLGRVVDVADGAGLANFVTDAAAVFGGIDIVVATVSALAIPDDEANWRKTFEVFASGLRLQVEQLPSDGRGICLHLSGTREGLLGLLKVLHRARVPT